MEALRKRLLPPLLLVAICITTFVIAAAAVSGIHLDAYGDMAAWSEAHISRSLVLELAVMLAAFAVLFTLSLAILQAGNRRLIANYRQERRMTHVVKAAEDANGAKSIFLNDISHELRTPLNSILGFSEVMQAGLYGPLDNPQYVSCVDDIHRSGRHLLSIIDDLADLSKTQSGETEMNEAPLNLAECLETTGRMFSCLPEAIDLTFKFDIHSHLPWVMADKDAIIHVLENLLTNAIKYTLTGSIIIKAQIRQDGDLEFSITDTGIGIPKDEVQSITQRFNQVDPSWKRKFDGTGLGLALVKALMARHDGDAAVTSEIGVGTTVTCYLPRRRILLAAASKESSAA